MSRPPDLTDAEAQTLQDILEGLSATFHAKALAEPPGTWRAMYVGVSEGVDPHRLHLDADSSVSAAVSEYHRQGFELGRKIVDATRDFCDLTPHKPTPAAEPPKTAPETLWVKCAACNGATQRPAEGAGMGPGWRISCGVCEGAGRLEVFRGD